MIHYRIKRELWRVMCIFFWLFFVFLYISINTNIIKDFLWLIIVGPIIAVLVYLGFMVRLTKKETEDLEDIEKNPIIKLNQQILAGLGSVLVFFYILILILVYNFNFLFIPILSIFMCLFVYGIYYILSANRKIREEFNKNKRLLKLQRKSMGKISYAITFLVILSIFLIFIGQYIFDFKGMWLFLVPMAFPVSFYIEKIEKQLYKAINEF